MLYHALREHVNIGHGDGPNCAGWLAETAQLGMTDSGASQARGQRSRMVGLLADGIEANQRATLPACSAARLLGGMKRAAVAAEPHWCGVARCRGRRGIVVIIQHQRVDQDNPVAAERLLERPPDDSRSE